MEVARALVNCPDCGEEVVIDLEVLTERVVNVDTGGIRVSPRWNHTCHKGE